MTTALSVECPACGGLIEADDMDLLFSRAERHSLEAHDHPLTRWQVEARVQATEQEVVDTMKGGTPLAREGRLDGAVAIVSGSGRGIGRGIALAFSEEGAKVVVASRTQSTVDEVVAEIEAAGGVALGVRCDIGQRDQILGLVHATVDRFGTVDILVNNAQGFGTQSNPAMAPVLTPLEILDEDEWEYTYRTGVIATMLAMKAVFPHMKESGGKIINFGSSAGQYGSIGSAAYNSNKEAVRGLSRTAAREWGRYKINVNVINPSIQTDAMQHTFAQRDPALMAARLADLPMREFGLPKDVGKLAIFLASPESNFITGETVMIDSGLFMHA